ncbi:MAG: sensor histidine kinase [Ruminiclostridium sp.]
MATKWKKISRSNWFKILLAVLYIVCFGAMGFVTCYVPANYSLNYIEVFEEIPWKSFEEKQSETLCWYALCLESLAFDPAHQISEADDGSKTYIDINAMEETASDPIMVNWLSAAVSNLNFYIRIETVDGSVYENNYDHKADLTFSHDKGWSDANMQRRGGDFNSCAWLKNITVGIPSYEYDEIVYRFGICRPMLINVLIVDLCLIAVIIILTVLMCRIIGEKPDGEKASCKFFRAYYEILTVLAIIAGICAYQIPYSLLFYNSQTYHTSFWPVSLILTCAILLTALMGAILLYLICCISVRAKNNCLRKGSLLFVIGRGLLFAKDVFTGQSFKSKASKKVLAIDASFFVVTLLSVLCLFIGSYVNINSYCVDLSFSTPVFMTVTAIILIMLILFLYGRYFIIKDQSELEKQIEQICSGNDQYRPVLSKNSAYEESSRQLTELGENYKKSLAEQIKAERMKVDLITNVSHDLKTPLTSIISYVDLLSKETLPPQAQEYVEVLQQKSERLQSIVADVFDLAKVSSGEIAVSLEALDLSKLSEQTFAEMEDKFAGFEVRKKICQPPVTVLGDGKKLYRIIQNLLDNALKYSLKGTRIYYTLEKCEDKAVVSIVNTSSYEMDFTAEEIMERFVRGDKARTSEGSGLGLAIAKGFANTCGGDLRIEIEGDMFKAIVEFPLLENTEQNNPE